MSKYLFIIRNILYVIIIIPLLFGYSEIVKWGEKLPYIFYIFIIILGILFLIQYIYKKNDINLNRLFNFTCIVSFIFILIVILRSQWDSYIIIKDSNAFLTTSGELHISKFHTFFISSNMKYFLPMIIGLDIYNILLNIPRKTNKEKTPNGNIL